MWTARTRSLSVVGADSVDEMMRILGGAPVALRCTTADCPACNAFGGAQRDSFEKTLSNFTIVDWDCDRPRMRAVAKEAGVTRIPAYIIMSSEESKLPVIRVPHTR